ncbi:tRNA (adenosine(37)-N6)-threonylcarbamoyltransferase complex ATPase subunit type 1 TsaE [Candidatus Nomurabacteria bacterium RIFCSPLOWO2_01_FULL_42_20]|uniref:tRNA threonylcarbamoyladenosine biosynthesis protein TsaE n=1 Tax=Candidatus Nomurabacteria bacterium RIFCSPHIGHO2_01_FULL_42_16 TaxID=1801743 RepID=A0A1F6VHN1_9BACT|nr:MAG: tRNA (adenosine(37)-N6)-threonylcarbamoyltransferase complex ATPase subunit type 1 TsaE [Candidatus Nomurabacteria bacterium RIFCSPHIGHO2_01_FULL_42_16]OGI91323.1 MAG: tRNA (adenosine(37)-N6)-threonylcarbamoyltransferase complex ATPase subunit type 1 TsaE [Candidatus Nomurabacteria bacterium RIFCSPLOWO2_01_FULL_42_20]
MKTVSKNIKETAKLANALLKQVIEKKSGRNRALVIGLCGELGSGKTTFTQELAKLLDIKEHVVSPTFVLMKTYKLRSTNYKLLIHIDAYRLEKPKELLKLGWRNLIKDPKNLILVEWADKIKKILPKDAIFIYFSHLGRNKRRIEIKT